MNNPDITHNNKTGKGLQYSLDFTVDPYGPNYGLKKGCSNTTKSPNSSNLSTGQIIVAPADGKITWISTDLINIAFSTGGCMQIGHFKTRYSNGQLVKQNDPIGEIGVLSNGTGGTYSHLHINAWSNKCYGIKSGFDETNNLKFYGNDPFPLTSTTNAYYGQKVTQVIPNNNTAPTAPTSLSVTPLSSSSVNFSWSDNSNNETEFKIYYSGSYNNSVSANITSQTYVSLAPSTQYCFQVSAKNNYGESALSSQKCGTTMSAGSAPATPTISSVTGLSTSGVRISWNDVSNETGYYLYRSGSYITSLGAGSTSYDNYGLSSGSSYCYQVSSYNSYGQSAKSSQVCGNTLSASAPNLALNKSASATSQESSSFTPQKAVDGSTSTRWASIASTTLGTQNFIIDLGNPTTLNQVVVKWEAAYATNYFVGAANPPSGSSCGNQTYYGVGNQSASSAQAVTTTLGSKYTRCILIQMYSRAYRMNNYSIYEVEVYNR